MFNKGDVVILKSGGPRMTVCSLPSTQRHGHFCEWFSESGKLERANFPGEALMLVSETRFLV